MSNGKPPSYQHYPDKALGGTSHLSDAAFTTYWRLLWWIWLNTNSQFSIKNDENFLKSVTKLSKKKFEKIWYGEIMNPAAPLFRVEGKDLVSNGLRKESDKQKANRVKRQGAANARWNKSKSNANAKQTECLPSPTPATPVKRYTKEEMEERIRKFGPNRKHWSQTK